jgi:hypothetical protein
MAGKSIDDVFAAIVNDCQAVAVEAVKNAAKKVQHDIIKEAESYLQKYYNNYAPKQYKRTYRLKRAILPYWADRTNKNGISIEVGVQYNSSALKGAYKSNSRFHQSGDRWISRFDDEGFNFDGGDNGVPEPDWIMSNFLEGIHPWAQNDSESTNSLMADFFETQLPNRINQYVQDELFNAITSRL